MDELSKRTGLGKRVHPQSRMGLRVQSYSLVLKVHTGLDPAHTQTFRWSIILPPAKKSGRGTVTAKRCGYGTKKGISEGGREGTQKNHSVYSTLLFVLPSYLVSIDL